MKKVMIGILVLIPVLLLAVVGVVSAVVSTRTYIGVEDIQLDASSVKIEFGETYYDLNDFLTVTVLPEKATNKSFEWFIEDLSPLDESYEEDWKEYLQNKDDENYSGEVVFAPAALLDEKGNETESNTTGKIKISSYCTFYVSVQAESVKARCFVHVWSGNVESVSVKGANTLKVGESTLLDAVCTPVDTVITSSTWSVDDESVLYVDENGVVTAKSEGSANVFVTVTGENGTAESEGFTVSVTKGATALGQNVTVGSQTIVLSTLGLTQDAISELVNCTMTEGNLVVTDVSTPATFNTANGNVTISVCSNGDITIENLSLFAFDENAQDNYILTAGSSIKLKAVYLDKLTSSAPIAANVAWTSSVPAVASVSGGTVTGHKSGVTTITAQYEGKSVTMKLAVEKKVSTLILDVTDSSLQVGLARETVFAASRYSAPTVANDTAKINNGLTVGFMLPTVTEEDEETFYKAFDFSVYENGALSDKAYFDDNRLVFDAAKINGLTTLTVTVKAKYPLYKSNNYATKSFTVKVIDGVAVDSYAALKKAGDDRQNISIEKNIRWQDDVNNAVQGTYESVYTYKNIYGNGNMVWAGKGQMGATAHLIKCCGNDSIVSNLWLRANEVGEEITNVEDNESLAGAAIVFGSSSSNWGGEHLTNQTLEYSIIENARSCAYVYGADVTFNGCIVRNSYGTGIYVRTKIRGENIEYGHVTIRNSVTSNLVGMTFSFHFDGFENANPELARQAIAENKICTLKQEGFLDIYNWQEINVIDLIPDGTVDESTKQLLSSMVRSLVTTSPMIDDVSVEYNGVKYFHLGFMSVGITDKSYLKATFEDERLQAISSAELLPSTSNLLTCPIFLFSYGKNSDAIGPTSTYSINNKMIDRLHGIGIEKNENPTVFDAAESYS